MPTIFKEINWDWPSKLSFTTTTTVTRLVEEKPRGLAAIFSKPKLVEKVRNMYEEIVNVRFHQRSTSIVLIYLNINVKKTVNLNSPEARVKYIILNA